jgi:hypothetical protein
MALVTPVFLNPAPGNAVVLVTFTADGNDATVPLGFKPTYCKIINKTTTNMWEICSNWTSGEGAYTTGSTGVRTDASSAPTYYDGAAETGSGDGYAPGITIPTAFLNASDEVLIVAYK